MFQEIFAEVVVIIRCGQKQSSYLCEVIFNQHGLINVTDLLQRIRFDGQFFEEGDAYYFDHMSNDYFKVEQDTKAYAFNIISQNKIIIRFEPKISDEVLANPPNQHQLIKIKRSGERKIKQVFGLVLRWRKLYMWGMQNQNGDLKKYNLDQSAEQVGVPRKSLEDYFLLLRVGRQLGFNFSKHQNDKMGVLRKYIKSMPKLLKEKQKNSLKQDVKQKIRVIEDKFFRDLGRQLQSQLLMKSGQQKIYDVLQIEGSKSFSDQDMLEQFEQ